VPNVRLQYWSMRTMAYIGSLVFVLAVWGLWLLWRNKIEKAKWFLRFAVWSAVLPFLMNTAGWVLTESGRQPWIVQGLQRTEDGLSPSISTTTVAISLGTFALLYGVLAVVEGVLMVRYSRRQLAPAQPPEEREAPVPAMTY
jgi:cytochrome d ubiquinol oxidase subunit I